MKKILLKSAIFLVAIFSFAFTIQQAPVDPWKPAQVMKTTELARILNDPNAKKPVIINVGPMANIKTAISTGAANSPEGMQKFRTEASRLKKTDKIVIYCGCCTMSNCPNIREAFSYLNKEGFKNHMVLDIQTGIVEDWSGKGYPMQ
jgi:thiosulfate/3-mercaptopyruvate sulfurtransferase